MKYTDILLDLDDTLIDTAKNTIITVEEIYNDYQLGKYFPSFNDFFSIYHKSVSQLWELYNKNQITKNVLQRERFIAPLSLVEEITEEQALVINDDYIQRIMRKESLIEGAKKLLDYLSSKYKLHILSNGFTEMQYKKIDSAGLTCYFDKVILSDAVGVNKPHPDIFEFTLKEIGVNKNKVIMIGDNLSTDIEGAYNSGIDQIWFNPSNKHYNSFKPNYIIKKLSEIHEIL
ncbi:MAG: YjjG family noncanonical pyrimidine nucleotidase [Dysgonomonas sp.]|nr:YjjG family noncanonical pyrimidine nucleotidase [Dysgonomonas sp.]